MNYFSTDEKVSRMGPPVAVQLREALPIFATAMEEFHVEGINDAPPPPVLVDATHSLGLPERETQRVTNIEELDFDSLAVSKPYFVFRPSGFVAHEYFDCMIHLRKSSLGLSNPSVQQTRKLFLSTKSPNDGCSHPVQSSPLTDNSRTTRGDQFESMVMSLLNQKQQLGLYPTVSKQELSRQSDEELTKLLLESIQTAAANEKSSDGVYLAQVCLPVPQRLQESLRRKLDVHSVELRFSRTFPDLLEVRRSPGGGIVVRVIDCKSSSRGKHGHFMQVTFYAMILNELLPSTGIVVDHTGEIWLPSAPGAASAYRKQLFNTIPVDVTTFFEVTLRAALHGAKDTSNVKIVDIEGLHDSWLRNPKTCSNCEFLQSCKAASPDLPVDLVAERRPRLSMRASELTGNKAWPRVAADLLSLAPPTLKFANFLSPKTLRFFFVALTTSKSSVEEDTLHTAVVSDIAVKSTDVVPPAFGEPRETTFTSVGSLAEDLVDRILHAKWPISFVFWDESQRSQFIKVLRAHGESGESPSHRCALRLEMYLVERLELLACRSSDQPHNLRHNSTLLQPSIESLFDLPVPLPLTLDEAMNFSFGSIQCAPYTRVMSGAPVQFGTIDEAMLVPMLREPLARILAVTALHVLSSTKHSQLVRPLPVQQLCSDEDIRWCHMEPSVINAVAPESALAEYVARVTVFDTCSDFEEVWQENNNPVLAEYAPVPASECLRAADVGDALRLLPRLRLLNTAADSSRLSIGSEVPPPSQSFSIQMHSSGPLVHFNMALKGPVVRTIEQHPDVKSGLGLGNYSMLSFTPTGSLPPHAQEFSAPWWVADYTHKDTVYMLDNPGSNIGSNFLGRNQVDVASMTTAPDTNYADLVSTNVFIARVSNDLHKVCNEDVASREAAVSGKVVLLLKRFIDFNSEKVRAVLSNRAHYASPLMQCLLSERPEDFDRDITHNSLWYRREDVAARVDLMRPSSGLSTDQKEVINHLLSNPSRLTLLWGPPGTGKTTTISHAIKALIDIERQVPHKDGIRVLVVATTRDALKEIQEKLLEKHALHVCSLEKDAPTSDLSYIGAFSDLNAANKRLLADGFPEGKRSGRCQVVMSTVWQIYKLMKGDLQFRRFDALIIDEASQMPVGPALIAGALLTESPKILVAGDLLQLPPILESIPDIDPSIVHAQLLNSCRSSIMQALIRGINPHGNNLVRLEDASSAHVAQIKWLHTIQLSTSYRSVEEVVNFVGRRYPSGLATGRSAGPRMTISPHANRPLTVLLTTNEVNTIVALLVQRCTIAISTSTTCPSMRVVTPHRRQRQAIRSALDAQSSTSKLLMQMVQQNIKVDTTEKAQGSEADIVLVALGDGIRYDSDFPFDFFRLNVAISRARDQVLVCLQRPPDGVVDISVKCSTFEEFLGRFGICAPCLNAADLSQGGNTKQQGIRLLYDFYQSAEILHA